MERQAQDLQAHQLETLMEHPQHLPVSLMEHPVPDQQAHLLQSHMERQAQDLQAHQLENRMEHQLLAHLPEIRTERQMLKL